MMKIVIFIVIVLHIMAFESYDYLLTDAWRARQTETNNNPLYYG